MSQGTRSQSKRPAQGSPGQSDEEMEPPLHDLLIAKVESMIHGLERKLDSKLDEKFGAFFPQLKAELKAELKTELKDELVAELKAELLPLLRTELAKDTQTRAASNDEAVVNKVHHLESLVESQARQARSANLICHGLAEDNAENVSARVAALFDSNSSPPVVVSEARRLGAPSVARTKPRPVLISFSGVAAKHAALKHSKALRQRQIFLDPDLTPQQQRIRVSMRPHYVALKTAGKQPFWREERLFVREGDRVREHMPVPGPPPAAAPGGAAAPGATAAGPSQAAPSSPGCADSYAEAVRR
jgi:hypothetical protein